MDVHPVAHHHRQAAGHRLDRGHGEVLRVGREHPDVRVGEQGELLRPVQHPGDARVVAEVAGLQPAAHRSLETVIVGPGDDEVHVVPLRGDEREGPDEQVETLLRRQPAEEDDEPPIPDVGVAGSERSPRREIGELRRVHTEGDDDPRLV